MKPDKNINKVCDESVFLVLDEGSTTRGTANIGPKGESLRVRIKTIPRNFAGGICGGCVFSFDVLHLQGRECYDPARGLSGQTAFGCGGGYPHCVREFRPAATELVWVEEGVSV